jgi:branched-chain amino acid transport system ATP-binding protein
LERKTLLEVKDLRVHYEAVEALRGVSLRVPEASTVIVIGANGAGKSTLLKTISGLLQPTTGSIVFDGTTISPMTPQEITRKGVVHVPEGRRVFPYMSVLDNLKIGADARSDRDGSTTASKLEEVYRRFPILRDRRKQQAGSLSGGEQQMLAIGRALMAGPRLILMDEPSLGLAPMVVREVAETISSIRAEGVSILLVEQNARMALHLADWGYVLEVGSFVFEGSPTALSTNDQVRRAYLGG